MASDIWEDRDDVVAFGIDATSDELILEPIGVGAAAAAIGKLDPAEELLPTPAVPTFALVEGVDPFDPREVGWIVVVGRDDPQRDAISTALEPLALRRGGPGTWGPIEFPPDCDLDEWIRTSYNVLDPVPRFVLLAGSPRHLPFALQSALGSVAWVGRLDFSTVSDGTEQQRTDAFDDYVDKVMRNERGDTPPTTNLVTVWATNHGGRDPTLYSRLLLAAPLAQRIEDRKRYRVERLFDQQATAARLTESLATSRPALLFTASHGVAVPIAEGVDAQAASNGALFGQDRSRFGATDLPAADVPFVEGGVVFQFACFGYGTPAVSGYTHWSSQVRRYESPFELVSALPKAAIAHPRGPIGYIGHADYALLHAFADPTRPGSDGQGPTAPRLAAFRSSLDEALYARPVGAILDPMAGQLSLINLQLTDIWNRARAAGAQPVLGGDLIDTFLRRNDARYYFLLGDPAARPRIDDGK